MGSTVPTALFVLHQGAYGVALLAMTPDPDAQHKYWLFGFTEVQDRSVPALRHVLTQHAVEDLVERYIEERSLFLQLERYHKELEELRKKIEAATERLDAARQAQREVPFRRAAGFRVVLDEEARVFFDRELRTYFRRKWTDFLGNLSATQKEDLEKEYDSLDGDDHFETFMRYLEPYLGTPPGTDEKSNETPDD
jgi:hypothetical protein